MALTRKELKQADELQLSDNFTLLELIRSTRRPDLVEYPREEIIEKLREFVTGVLQPLREECNAGKPVFVDSGYRNPALNGCKEIGGVKHSIHQVFYQERFQGVAADINIGAGDIYELFSKIAAWENKMLKKVILYPGRNFIHIDSSAGIATRVYYVKIGKDYRLLTAAEAQNIKQTLLNKFSIKV